MGLDASGLPLTCRGQGAGPCRCCPPAAPAQVAFLVNSQSCFWGPEVPGAGLRVEAGPDGPLATLSPSQSPAFAGSRRSALSAPPPSPARPALRSRTCLL